MKISHSELAKCVEEPRNWLREKVSTAPHGLNMGYNRALVFSIYHFHKTQQPAKARKYLKDMIVKHDFKNVARADALEDALDSYLKWYENENPAVSEWQVRIRLSFPPLTLVGEVPRIDVAGQTYRAILLGEGGSEWKLQLRMPLIQQAIGMRIKRPIEEVSVGVQSLDGSGLETISYSANDLRRAQRKFTALAEALKGYATMYSTDVLKD